jgi:hypothetical protein
MNDMIPQFMNQFKFHKTYRKMVESSIDMVQINVNRIKLVETEFCQEKMTFLYVYTTLDTMNH